MIFSSHSNYAFTQRWFTGWGDSHQLDLFGYSIVYRNPPKSWLFFRTPFTRTSEQYDLAFDAFRTGTFRLCLRLFPATGGLFVFQWVA